MSFKDPKGFVRKVFKKKHPKGSISRSGLTSLTDAYRSFLDSMVGPIARNSFELRRKTHRPDKTLTTSIAKEIIEEILPYSKWSRALTKELDRRVPSADGTRQKPPSRAGILLPINRVHEWLRQPSGRASVGAAIATNFAAQHILERVIDEADRAKRLDSEKRDRLTEKHILQGIQNDPVLAKIFEGAVFRMKVTPPLPHKNSSKTKKKRT